MDENKQFDNNGEAVTPPPVPAPAPRYRHEHTHDAHDSRCTGKKEDIKEDAFVLRIKHRHIKLAALLLAAFMLGSLWTQMKYSHNSYASKVSTSINEMIRGRSSSYSSGGSYSIQIPSVTNERIIRPASPDSYTSPEASAFDSNASCENCYEYNIKAYSEEAAQPRSFNFYTK